MKRKTFLTAVIALFLLVGAKSALADDCAALGGTLVPAAPPNECRVSTLGNHATGSFTLNETLHILGTGSIIVDPPSTPGLSITITAGNFLMDDGALIDGNATNPNGNPCPGIGRNITVDLQAGDIDLAAGSTIRSISCSGGAIVLTTTASHTANIDGSVLSVGLRTGDGSGLPGGGPITIVAGCSLTVSDTGVVSSRGRDPGADLVHLEGCAVTILGIVESTGDGHVNPTNPPNKCNDGVHLTAPPPSSFFTGCVEVWSGTTVTIDSTGTHKGELNADIGGAGGTQGRGWVDIYANGNVNIVDGTGNDRFIISGGCGLILTTFAVHSNGGLCQNTDDGGLITIKSLGADVVATGHAIQADAISAGSNGGEIHVEADKNISFTDGVLFARGDFGATGGFGNGGKIGTAGAQTRAFHGALNWTAGEGNVLPTGNLAALLPAKRGVILLEYCTAINLGAAFPFLGGAATTPTTMLSCAPALTHPVKATLGSLPTGTCLDACRLTQSKKGTKFFDTNNNHIKNVGEPGLANWTINAYEGNLVAFTTNTDANGNYTLPLLASPHTYTVCEVQQAGFTQTCPQLGVAPNGTGCNGAAITNAADCSALTGQAGSVGYSVTLQPGVDDTGNDFGNFRSTPQCPEDPKAVLNLTVGNPASGVPNYDTLQEAYDNAQSGETIGMFSKTNENVILGGDKTLKITQCTNARITAADSTKPVWSVTSTGKLTIVGPDSVGGTIGWLVAGNGGHTLKSIRANGASQYGVLITSNKNEVSWNDVSGNGTGIRVVGNTNTLKGGDVSKNGTNGVELAGDGNTLSGATVESNGGNGVVVTGSSNQIKSNKANLNTSDGFNNGAGASNKYSGNTSNNGGKENGGAEYRFVTAGVNGGSNRADGINVPSAAKCPNFAQAGSVCE